MTGLAARLMPPGSVAYPGSHLGLRWRPMMAADGPAVFDLVRRVERADGSAHATTASEIADMMEAGRSGDALDTIVGLDGDGQLVSVAVVRVRTRVHDMAIAEVKAHIDPHWRGRGVGRALLYWQDGRARQMLVDHFGEDAEVPAAISNIIDAHMTDRRRLSIAAGFYARRTFAIMYREVEGGEAAPTPRGGYRVLPWAEVDTAAVRDLHMDVFADHFWPQMREEWWDEALAEIEERWSFVVLSPEGEVAGYSTAARRPEQWVTHGRTEVYITLVGVGRAHRGRGVVRALVEAVTEAAARAGVSRVGLDVDTGGSLGAHAIYEHLGFIDQGALVYYTIDH